MKRGKGVKMNDNEYALNRNILENIKTKSENLNTSPSH
jgi:hypothetical protein